MSTFYIKCSPQLDLYLKWSTVVDAPVLIGTRGQLLRHDSDCSEDRLARADESGVSVRQGYPDHELFKWQGEGGVYLQLGWLPRENIEPLAKSLLEDETADVSDLLNPFHSAGSTGDDRR